MSGHQTPGPAACQNCGSDDIVYSPAERAWLCVQCDVVVKPTSSTYVDRGHANGSTRLAPAAAVGLKEIHSRLLGVQISLDAALSEMRDSGAAENVEHARTAISRLLGSLEYFGIGAGT